MSLVTPRTWLYVPGSSARKLERARTVGADAVIADLEDGVAPGDKEQARDLVRTAFTSGAYGATQRWVRINAPADGDRWREDIEAVAPAGPDGIVVPKVSRPQDVRAVREALDRAASASGAPRPALALIVTESPAGVLAMRDTLAAVDDVAAAFWGAEDLSAELGASATVDDNGGLLDVFRVARSLFLLEAAGAGVPAIDTPHLVIEDLDGVRREAVAASRTGFAGKQVIHPSHVPIINEAFIPTEPELADARRLVEAFAETGGGALRVDGNMVDPPHLRRARRVLARAQNLQEQAG